jgi:aminoglycoside 3-N-acetyltransferase I
MAKGQARRMTDVSPPRRLGPGDDLVFDGMLDPFGAAFADSETYGSARPGTDCRRRLLATGSFVALVTCDGDRVVGALAGYERATFEAERSEFHICDLAVAASHRRRGIATALIRAFGRIAQESGGRVVFVQADPEDAPAVALSESLGTREGVFHVDIAPG